MDRPRCYNRPAFEDTVWVQNGWQRAYVSGLVTRVPLMKEIPDHMSKGCHQHGPMGEATLHPEKWDCAGCCWKPES